MSRKNEEYPVFSEVKRSEIPENAVLRELPAGGSVKSNIYAMAAFVLAILSIFPCLAVLSAPVSLAGFIFAIAALCQGTRKKGFAISGLIINLIAFVCSVLFMFFFAGAITDFASSLVRLF